MSLFSPSVLVRPFVSLIGFRARWSALVLASIASSVALQAQSNYAPPYAFTTLAGYAGHGSADGTGSEARFYHPSGVAADASGNLYVADLHLSTLRKITPAGVVTTLVGVAGFGGTADGVGRDARLNYPLGVAIDTAGNIFVGDGSYLIRKITPAGEVTTLAGSAYVSGYADGIGSAAQFGQTTALAVDGAGNVYVADAFNQAIRKITPAGVVTTLAGKAGITGATNGLNADALFNGPKGLAFDGAGNLYVADTYNHTIRKISAIGIVTTLAGSSGNVGVVDGSGSAARFSYPNAVASDGAGNLYVAEGVNGSRIRKVTLAGDVTTVAGSADQNGSTDGTGSAAGFNQPHCLTVGAAGNIYVADTLNATIRKVTPGGVVTTFAGVAAVGSSDGIGSAARFSRPSHVAVDSSSNVYVSDSYNGTIRKITPAGAVTTLAGKAGQFGSANGTGSAARFLGVGAMASDPSGNIYVMDNGAEIRKITPTGVVTSFAGNISNGSGDGTATAARFNGVQGLASDAVGNIYVADTNNQTVRKITPAGLVTTLAGSTGSVGSTDGTGTAARFNYPFALAADAGGNIYVADTFNCTVRKITPTGVVTTLAGSTLMSGYIDGTGSAARFSGGVVGMAVDGAGNVYLTEQGGGLIRRMTPAGVVTTLAGKEFSVLGTSDGVGSEAEFNSPIGIAVDSAGKIYVADSENNTIRLGVLAPPILTGQDVGSGTVGQSFTHTPIFSGEPSSFSTPGLPAGLSLNTATGVISGTPTVAGTFLVTLNATNSGGTAPATLTLNLAKGTAGLSVSDLVATYDGLAHTATATTVPASLGVTLTYNGATTAPTNAGVYYVVGTINDANYLPTTASGSVYITKAPATVALSSLASTYNGLPHGAIATTVPPSLAVSLTYNGSGTAPTNAGTYAVVGTINEANYTGVSNGSLVIAKSTPVITWTVPAAVNPGTILSNTQLNATASIPGSFTYSPANGAVLTGGFQTLTATFTPTDTANYNSTTAQQTLTVIVGPSITTQPLSRAAFVGDSITLTCAVSGAPAPTLQWQKGGIAIPGATASTLNLSNVQLSDAGSYSLHATNVAGTLTSRFARLVVLSPQQNAITYATTKASTGVTAGGMVNFDYFVTNIGTKAWGAKHYLSIRDVNNAFVAFSSLIGILPGETTTANLNFPAPTVPGTYTYYVQGLEDGVEFFSTQTTVVLTVLAPVTNAITYNTTTFPVSAAPGSNVIFTYSVTNTGTATWGAGHLLSLKNSSGTTLSSTPLTVLAPGASKTVNLSFTVPTTPGSYTYTVQASQTGVGNFGTQANLTLVVLAPQPNAIVYNRVRYPDEVVPGAILNLKYTLSNAGTQSWGAGHYVSLRDSADNYLAFVPLSSTAAGATKTVDFTLTAPTAPGTYTYYVQALEDGVEFFSTQDVVIIRVVALPLGNAISYNTSTIPATAAPGAVVNFTANVTNRGTRTWGATHYLSFRDVDNTFLAFPTLNGVAPGANRTANLSFTAPTTPGIYTYTLQAFEDGVSFFEMADTVVLLVQ